MSQQFNELQGSGLIKNDREKINQNFKAVASDFAGAAFPTNNLEVGMTCYRTDLKKLYRYLGTNNNSSPIWQLDTDLNIVDKFVLTDSKATQTEAETGTNDSKWMTPLKVLQAFKKMFIKATQSEAEAGTDDTKVMTPLRVKQSIMKNAPAPTIATQQEAEAQANQNNTKMMTPLRVYQAIVAYFTKFLAAAVFTGIVKLGTGAIPADTANDNSVPSTSWVKKYVDKAIDSIVTSTAFKQHIVVSYNMGRNGYVKFGDWVGKLILQWGLTMRSIDDYNLTVTYPLAFSSLAIPISIPYANEENTKSLVLLSYSKTNFVIRTNASVAKSTGVTWISVGV